MLNAALVSLSERRREVATLRVLGYTPAEITWVFAGEGLILGTLGIGLGLVGGVALAYGVASAYSTELYRFPTIVLPQRLLQSAALIGAFLAAAQGIVYQRIRRLDWRAGLAQKE